MVHGPGNYNEKSSLLRDQRPNRAASIGSDDGHRALAGSGGGRPTHAAQWSSRPRSRSRPRPGVSPGEAVAGCCGIGFMYIFIVAGLISLGLFLRAEFAQPLPPYVRKVAIIGAGPAGASAAYNVRKFAHREGILVDITVYEKNDFVGGRTTCRVNAGDERNDYIVQIAAKGFHASDKILVDTVNELRLTPVMLDGRQDTDLSGRSGERWGVFDGSRIVFRQAHPTNFLTGWWWSFKLFFFYGYSPGNTRNAVTNTISKLRRIYSPRFFPFESLTAVMQDLELNEEVSSTGSQLLDKYKVSTPFQRDLINAWTRRDFGQNLGQISGLAAMTSPDDGGDMTVEGGHWTLFEEMISSSKAELNLGTTTFGIRRMDWGGWVLASQPAGTDDPQDGDYQEFDSVILAAPFQTSNLEIKGGQLAYIPDEIEYSPIHVTLFRSRRKLSRSYFRHNDDVPETMLTTLGSDEYDGLFQTTGTEGVGRAGFYSITSVKQLARLEATSGVIVEEYLYKIISPGMIEDDQLYELLGASREETGVLAWTYRHEWASAYPYIYPRNRFGELKLDNNLWYTGTIEEVSSSMELSSLMGANVAKIVVDGWAEEGRGKRPDRRFDEAKAGKETLYPETVKSFLRMQYEGIWAQKLASGQEKPEEGLVEEEEEKEEKEEEEEKSEKSEELEEKSEEKSEEKPEEKSEEEKQE